MALKIASVGRDPGCSDFQNGSTGHPSRLPGPLLCITTTGASPRRNPDKVVSWLLICKHTHQPETKGPGDHRTRDRKPSEQGTKGSLLGSAKLFRSRIWPLGGLPRTDRTEKEAGGEVGSEWMGGEEHRHLQRKNTETSMHEYKIVKEPYLASRRPAKNRMERSPCVWGWGGCVRCMHH